MRSMRVIRVVSVLLSVLMLCACSTGTSDDTTAGGSTPITDAETEITEVPIVKVILENYKTNEKSFSFGISFEDDFDGVVAATLKCGESTVEKEEKVTVAKETLVELTLDGAEFLNGDYEFTLSASDADASDSAKVKFVGGLPQLSEESVKWVIANLTLEEKTKLLVAWSATIAGLAGSSYEIERLGVPKFEFADASSGLRLMSSSMAYPSLTNLASTWNDDLMGDLTKHIASDFSAYGVDILLGPGLNIQKNIFGGRNFEYFSEDPYLTGMMAANYTNGLQANGIGACLKHYAANSQETSRGSSSSEVTERALREIYLKGFGYALKYSDPYTVMTSYNRINGRYGCANKDLIQTVLRDEFGFKGYVMSDWEASGARVQSVNAGNDMYCGSPKPEEEAKVIFDAVKNGKIKESQVDFCCENILSVAAKCEVMTRKRVSKQITNKPEKYESIRRVGAESMVLLKNDNATLPFNNKKVAMFGNASYVTEHCGYGACYVYASDFVSIYDGLAAVDGISVYRTAAKMYDGVKQHEAVVNSQLINPANDPLEVRVTEDIAREAAANSNIAIFTISRISREGVDHMDSIGDYYLNLTEREAIENLSREYHAKGKKLIVLINTGNPIEVESWKDLADAIVYIGLSGEQIGNSVADLLTGKENFSGKLTSTWPLDYTYTPASEYFPGNSETAIFYEDIYVGYRYYTTFDVDVSYEFGYGMSYTTFEYSDFNVTKNGNEYELSVKVKNTGDTAGKEVVQFYVSKPDGKNEQPKIELVGYGKTPVLNPGEEAVITSTVTYDELKTYYVDSSDWIIEQGTYKFSVGASVEDIKASSDVTVDSEILVLDVENISGPRVDFTPLSKSEPKPALSGEEDLAKGKPVTASFSEAGYDALYAVDGSRLSRWSGLGTTGPNYWLTVDLGQKTDISKIVLRWEANTEGEFSIYISDDNQNWSKVGDYKSDGIDTVTLKESGRYVRVQAPAKGFFSIFEFSVYK